jgi:hypothetical protein
MFLGKLVLSLHNKNINFDIPLSPNTATAVWGSGNTGKTCIYTLLQDAVNNKQVCGDYVFINIKSINNIFLLKEPVSAIFIIDDFDIIRDIRPEIIEYVNYAIHPVLLFGRNLSGVSVNKHYLYNSYNRGNTIYFKPVMPEPMRG